MIEVKNDIAYHVHIFSYLMPKVKKLFDTRKEAYSFLFSFFDEHFPWEKAEGKKGGLGVADLIENSCSITRIDLKKVNRDCMKVGFIPLDEDEEDEEIGEGDKIAADV
jgi:hypothetical protein